MTDPLTPAQRHRCMACIHSTGTKPERLVRRFLFACGLRFRLHVKRLPGSPDIVLPKYRTAIFVNGCFWHGHEGCRYFRLPQTHTDFWQRKIDRNRRRDRQASAALEEAGWHVVTLWECELKPATREQTLLRLYVTLNRHFLERYAPPGKASFTVPEAESLPAAAEPDTPYGPAAY